MTDDLTRKLEELSESDMRKVVGGDAGTSTIDFKMEWCDACGRNTAHKDGICYSCYPPYIDEPKKK